MCLGILLAFKLQRQLLKCVLCAEMIELCFLFCPNPQFTILTLFEN